MLHPQPAVVCYLDPYAVAFVHFGVDGERTAGLAGVAMKDAVRREFRDAQHGIVGRRAAFQRERDDPPGITDLICVCGEHAGPRLTRRRGGPPAVADRVRHVPLPLLTECTCWCPRS